MLSAITPKLRGIFIPGRRYKKSGALLEENRQIDLFADTASEKKDDRLSKALDAINAKYGRGTIFHLSEGVKKPWQMKREMLTPNYTTSWSLENMALAFKYSLASIVADSGFYGFFVASGGG